VGLVLAVAAVAPVNIAAIMPAGARIAAARQRQDLIIVLLRSLGRLGLTASDGCGTAPAVSSRPTTLRAGEDLRQFPRVWVGEAGRATGKSLHLLGSKRRHIYSRPPNQREWLALDTIHREFQEEIGQALTAVQLAQVLENIFEWVAARGGQPASVSSRYGCLGCTRRQLVTGPVIRDQGCNLGCSSCPYGPVRQGKRTLPDLRTNANEHS
jgi:hypothetical protein